MHGRGTGRCPRVALLGVLTVCPFCEIDMRVDMRVDMRAVDPRRHAPLAVAKPSAEAVILSTGTPVPAR